MTLKRLLIFSALILTSATVHADPYHRFWRGTKLGEMSSENFQKGLNEVFIGKTIQAGAGKGLMAYEPALTQGAAPGFPDEIALVTYQDESSYNAIRSTPEGKAYGELHWKYFDKSQS